MKIPSFNFASLRLGNFSHKQVKAASSRFMAFTKFVIRPSFNA